MLDKVDHPYNSETSMRELSKMFKVGVGQAEDIDVLKASRAALAQNRVHLGGIRPQAGIILCSSNFDHRQMLDSVLESLPGISLIGCTTAGDFSWGYGFSDDSITLILFAQIRSRYGQVSAVMCQGITELRFDLPSARRKRD